MIVFVLRFSFSYLCLYLKIAGFNVNWCIAKINAAHKSLNAQEIKNNEISLWNTSFQPQILFNTYTKRYIKKLFILFFFSVSLSAAFCWPDTDTYTDSKNVSGHIQIQIQIVKNVSGRIQIQIVKNATICSDNRYFVSLIVIDYFFYQ